MNDFHVIVPARYGSQRLPGKVLVPLAGRPMLAWVLDAARASGAATTTVATDDQRVVAVCESMSVPVVVTDVGHQSGSDRIAECARRLDLDPTAVIVNLQGDEPLTPPSAIGAAAAALARSDEVSMATLAVPICEIAELHDPNVVKVVVDHAGLALYFSRAPIPFARDGDFAAGLADGRFLRHVGIYAYRHEFLQHYTKQASSVPEQTEKLEQLRALHMGARIAVEVVEERFPAGVDTADDLDRVEQRLKSR